jgi:hypothetical protein
MTAALQLFACDRYGSRTLLTRESCAARHKIANACGFTMYKKVGNYTPCQGCPVGAAHRKKLEPVPAAALSTAPETLDRKFKKSCFVCGKPIPPGDFRRKRIYCDNDCKLLAWGGAARVDALEGMGDRA